MDLPLIEALTSKLNIPVTAGASNIAGGFGDANLARLANSYWLENDTIAFDVDGEKFLIDPFNIEETHVFGLLDLGFTIMHVMEYDTVSELTEAKSVYGIVAPVAGRTSIELMPKLVAQLNQGNSAVDTTRYIVTIHGICGV